jgi:hypothetical protein
MDKKYDEDKIVDNVEKAVLAGKCRHATEKESLELRLAALENIVKSCKELVERIYSDSPEMAVNPSQNFRLRQRL